jgi:HK97 gp10 family phage protein
MNIVVKILNIERLKRKLRNMATVKDRREVIRKAAREAARPLQAAMKQSKAFNDRTGLLRGNIKIRAMRKSRVRTGVNVIIRALDWNKALQKGLVKGKYKKRKIPKTYKLFYGSFVEMGTSRIRARKFMKTTSKRMKKSVQEDMFKRAFQLIKDLAK